MVQRFRRRRKLIQPGLQLRLSAKFLGLITLMLGLQYLLLDSLLHRAADQLPADRGLFLDQSGAIGLDLLAWSALVFLPLSLLVGIIGSFRFAGPLYRFKSFLRAVAAGEEPEDIRLRAGDELKDLAELLNEATRPLRGAQDEPQPQDAPRPQADEQDSPRRAAA